MDFFFRCVGVFIGLTVLLLLIDLVVVQTSLPFAGTLLFGTFTSLLLAILYGWIDEVYIQHGQRKIKE